MFGVCVFFLSLFAFSLISLFLFFFSLSLFLVPSIFPLLFLFFFLVLSQERISEWESKRVREREKVEEERKSELLRGREWQGKNKKERKRERKKFHDFYFIILILNSGTKFWGPEPLKALFFTFHFWMNKNTHITQNRILQKSSLLLKIWSIPMARSFHQRTLIVCSVSKVFWKLATKHRSRRGCCSMIPLHFEKHKRSAKLKFTKSDQITLAFFNSFGI